MTVSIYTEVGTISFYNYSIPKEFVFPEMQMNWVMAKCSPLKISWPEGWYTFSRSSGLSFSKQGLHHGTCPFYLRKGCLRKHCHGKSFDILLLWKRTECSNNTLIYTWYLSQNRSIALFRFYICFWCCYILKIHGQKYQLKLLVPSLIGCFAELSSRSASFLSFEGALVTI